MTLVVPAAPGWSRWGGTMASQGPRRGRQRLTQTSEEPKNAWRPARGRRGPLPMSHGALGRRGRHLQRQPPHLRGHQSGGAVGSEDPSSPPPDSTSEETQRGRPHPGSQKHRHGDGEHLRAECLRPRQEEEESRPDGSD